MNRTSEIRKFDLHPAAEMTSNGKITTQIIQLVNTNVKHPTSIRQV